VTLTVAENPLLADLISGAVPSEEFTRSQGMQLAAWVTAWLTSAQETYLVYEAGILDEEVWQARKSQAARALGNPTVRSVYDRTRTNYVENFLNALDEAIVESDGE